MTVRATSSSRITCDHLNSHSHEFIILNQAGAPIDLTDYTVTLRLYNHAHVLTELGMGTGFDVTNAPLGKTLLFWAAGEVPLDVGSYTGEVVIAKAGERFSSTAFPKLIIT